MRYHWDDFTLDREGTLLTRRGRQVDVTRRILDCVTCLVEQRHRVVSYDELIKAVWGHTNVSNNQLSQLVLSARRALGDDGHTQRLIKTLPGLGYRWIGPLCEPPVVKPSGTHGDDAMGPAAMQPREAASDASISVTGMQSQTGYCLSSQRESVVLTLIVPGNTAWSSGRTSGQMWKARACTPGDANPLKRLEAALWRGEFAQVRDGLAALQEALSETPEAQMLAIRLDIERERFDRAAARIAEQLQLAADAGDRHWQAQLLILRSERAARMACPASEQLEPAAEAVSLLESADIRTGRALGQALSSRGQGRLADNQAEAAAQDLISAHNLLLQCGDERRAAIAGARLAHAWLRMGRVGQAYARLCESLEALQRCGDTCNAIDICNLMTRVLLEQLRWDEALASSQRGLELASRLPEPRRHRESLRLRALCLTCAGRLQEAGRLLDEAEIASGPTGESLNYRAMHALASGRCEDALRFASAAVERNDPDRNADLWLDSAEGALLLWMIAARQANAETGTVYTLSAVHEALQDRQRSLAACLAKENLNVANGRSKKTEDAIRLIYGEAGELNRCWSMLLASEPLPEMLVEHGHVAQVMSGKA